jgi:hypothetical protein
MNINLLYILLFLVAFTIFNKTSEKFIENLTEENPLCLILKEEYEQKKCGGLLGLGEHEDCSKIRKEAENEGCQLN